MTDNQKAKQKIDNKIGKWYKVELNTYAIIYDLAKQRFDDLISEVESVTDKTIKMITGLLTLVSFFAGYLISKPNLINKHPCLLIISGIIILIELILLVIVVFPSNVKGKGISPANSIVQDLDNDDDKNYQSHLTYYNTVIALQENIDYMINHMKTRTLLYKISIPYFVLLISYIAIVAVYILS